MEPAPRALHDAIDDRSELLTMIVLFAGQFCAMRTDGCNQFRGRDFITHFTVDARLACRARQPFAQEWAVRPRSTSARRSAGDD